MRRRTDQPSVFANQYSFLKRKANGQFPPSNISKNTRDEKTFRRAQPPSISRSLHGDELEKNASDMGSRPRQDNDLELDAFDLELLAQSNTMGRSFQSPSYTETRESNQEGQRPCQLSRFFSSAANTKQVGSRVTPHRTLGSSSSDFDERSPSSPLARLQNTRINIPHQERDLEFGKQPQILKFRSNEFDLPLPHPNTEQLMLAHHDQTAPFQNIPVSCRGIVLLSVRELPDNYRSLFHFPVFNAVQSKCFQPVYKSDDNVVLSAPTGSGKTVIMELAICRLLHSLKEERFKVVYQAPTKSLCSERFRDWNKKFQSLGLQCAELTGDTDYTQLRNVQNSQIIITTPEKWDSMTRKWKDHARLMQLIKLFLIDEVHTLREARGATLEAVVSRMKSIGSNVRFVALSATIPNSEDIATWLGKDATNQHVPAHREHFGEEFRPVKLQRFVYGYQSHSNDFAFDKMCNSKLPDVIATHSCKKPIMIFCCTRNSSVATAKELARLWSMSNPPARLWKGPSKPIKVHNVDLKTTINAGVGFHHAGLDPSDRHQIETGFLQGNINIICCTSTLAVGVNLPCHLVIIKNTVGWQDGRCQEYSDLEVMQMLGRAGRPQFDDSATAVILTRKERVTHYEKLVSGTESLESCLHLNLMEHLNAEIGLGNVTSIESAIRWLAGTFLFVRLRRNPTYYRLKEDANKEDEDEMLRQICDKDIKLLRECGLVTHEGLKSTPFGDAMARYYIRFETMRNLLSLETCSTISQILSVIAQAEEYHDVRLKAGEKSLYKEINRASDIYFPINVDIALPAHKISLLIQSELGAVEFPSGEQFQKHKFAFQQDKNFVFSHVNRLIRCIIDCQISLKDAITVRNALELSRSLGARVWDNSPLQMKQIEQIGTVAVRKLSAAGINSIEELEHTEPHQIDMILSKNPPFGAKLLGRLSDFPKPLVAVKLMGKDLKPAAPANLRIKAEIGFLNEKCPAFFQGRSVHICFLAETSDGHLIDFRRISASKIKSGYDILLSTELQSPSQYISCYVMADDLAGTLRCAELKPNLSGFSFPSQLQVPSKLEVARKREVSHSPDKKASQEKSDKVDFFDYDDILFGDFLEAEKASNEAQTKPSVSYRAAQSKTVKSIEKQNSMEKKVTSVQLESGRWSCNHKCKDKLTCKHLCCREGLDKPPKPSKKPAEGSHQGDHQSQQLKIFTSIAKKSQHTIPVIEIFSQEGGSNDNYDEQLSTQSRSGVPQARMETEIGDKVTTQYNSSSSDYEYDSFDDMPSPSTLIFGNINSKPVENNTFEFGENQEETHGNILLPVNYSFNKLLRGDNSNTEVSVEGMKAPMSQQKDMEVKSQQNVSNDPNSRKRTQSFTDEARLQSPKRAKNNQSHQSSSYSTTYQEKSKNAVTESALSKVPPAPNFFPPIPQDMPDMDEIEADLLREFTNVVDFF